MAKKDDGKNLKITLQSVMDSVKTAAKDANLPKVKAPKATVPSQVKNVFIRRGKERVPVIEQPEALLIISMSISSAIKITYYLMAVDGQIYHSEEEKFDSICTELDPEFTTNREQILGDCREQLEKVIDPEDYYDVIQDGVEDALIASARSSNNGIPVKLFVWNLLTIAYSDGNYNEAERRLLKYIVRKLNIDKAVFLEMESSILTLLDLEKELNWIKTTDRPYLTIETMVNELINRKNTIFESVRDLISL